ncbi:MAG: adenylate/guanylate cyclase domain-containing protein [bacterium]
MKKFLREKINKHNISLGVLIALIVAFVMIAIHQFGLLDQFEIKTLDARFQNLNSFRQKPSNKIIILGIDDISVAKIGRWPWKRSEHAKIIDFLNLYGAKAIFYDIFFSYRDKDHPKSDQKFINSVKNAKNVYLAGKFIPISQNLQDDIQITAKDKFMKRFALDVKDDIPAREAVNMVSEGQEVAYEIPFYELASVAKKIGPVHVGKSEDGITRYQELVYKYKNDYYPSLSFGLAMDLLNIDKLSDWKNKGYLLDYTKIPLDEKDRMVVNWHGGYDNGRKNFKLPYEQYSAWKFIESYDQMEKTSKACGISIQKLKQILDEIFMYQERNEEIPDSLWEYVEKFPEDFELKFDGYNPTDLFRDKVILIGVASTSTTVRDVISTSLNQDIPGVYLHANVLDSILDYNFLAKLRLNNTLFSLIIILVSIFSGLSVFGIRNSIAGVIYPVIFALLYLFLAIFIFAKYNIWIDIVYTETTIITTFAISSAVYYILEGKDKQKVKKAMSNYLAPQIMEEVLSDPSKLNLGGSKRVLSILFSDIRGFTTISENLDPHEVVSMLNEYLSAMVEVIFRNKGTLDKFIGDAIMAFWNAPVEIEDHAFLAVKTAVEMLEELEKLREKWTQQGRILIDIGVGINTADVTVGNIGSDKIKDYTIIGDGVNLASRLESANKEYSTRIIISEFTYEKVKDKVNVRYLDSKKVKGKDKAVEIYEVISLRKEGDELCQN